jgi:hypothetical protein
MPSKTCSTRRPMISRSRSACPRRKAMRWSQRRGAGLVQRVLAVLLRAHDLEGTDLTVEADAELRSMRAK